MNSPVPANPAELKSKRIDVYKRQGIERVRPIHRETRRSRRHWPGHRDGVKVASWDGEVEGVDVVGYLLTVAPGAQQSAHVARIRWGALRIDHGEAGFSFRRGGHEIRTKRRLAGFVSSLTDAHVGGLRLRGPGRGKQCE